jgi:WhiB family redox-sensing transcriptional regulator
MPDPNSVPCGTTTSYYYGCRCDDCRTANREYARQYRARGPVNDLMTLLTQWERATDLEWYDDAACRGRPTQWWFAGDGRNLNSRTSRRAVDICEACAARTECLDWALSLPQPWHGIFAGMSPQQRQQEKQRRDNDTRNDT